MKTWLNILLSFLITVVACILGATYVMGGSMYHPNNLQMIFYPVLLPFGICTLASFLFPDNPPAVTRTRVLVTSMVTSAGTLAVMYLVLFWIASMAGPYN